MSTPALSALPLPVAIHLLAALPALAIGPLALWGTRKGSRSHRAAGYVWVTLMAIAALSAACIRDHRLPNIAGITPIHLFVVMTVWALTAGFVALARGDITEHRRAMRKLYWGGCVLAGSLAFLPGRFLGQWLWSDLAGLY